MAMIIAFDPCTFLLARVLQACEGMQRVDPILPAQRTGYIANLLTQQARMESRRKLKATASKPSVTAPSAGSRIDIRA